MKIFLIFLVFSGITIRIESSFAKNVASTKETLVSQDKKHIIATTIGISSISKAAVTTFKPVQMPRNISIENFTSTMNWTTRELSISWHVNSSFKNDISFYIIYIINDSGNCSRRIIYNIQGKTDVQIKNKSINCSEYLNFSINSFSTFNKTIQFKDKISMFSIELYGGNQSQTQKLNDQVIKYQLEKPTLTHLLKFKERSENYLILKWQANVSKNINETIMGYKIKYLNISLKFNFTKSEVNITNLNHCSKYCFNISTFNDAGSSPDSEEYCNFTLAPNLAKVKLENILSGYENSRFLNWTYSGSEKCPIKYQLEYWFNHSINNTISINNSRSYRISNLTLNKIYSARIKPITIMDTNNKIKNGEYSNVVQFYTGIENISISNLSCSMDWIKRELSLSWNINQTLSNSLSNYIIEIFDQKKICVKQVIYQNNFYNETTKNMEPLKSCENQSNVNVLFNENFHHKIFCNKTKNVSIEIFGTNLKGRQKLNKVNITIEMQKPDPIKNITVNGKDLQSFNLTLVKSEPVDENKPVMGYRIKYIENFKGVNTTNVNEPYFHASNLNPCTKYCFNISTYNDAGFSPDINRCVSTNATNLSEVKLTNISNGYQNERQINWTYNEKNTCPVSYTVEYWIKKSSNNTIIKRINETNYGIFHLQFNEIYEVRVFPVTEFDTADGIKIGNHSNIVEFFTGEENIFISNLTYSMDWTLRELSISWNINNTFAQSLFNYAINIFDHSNNWTRTIIYQNSSKDVNTTKNMEPLKSCENQSNVNVSFNENFHHKIFCCNKTKNVSIEIFGTNLKGRHKLNKKNIIIEMQEPDPIKNITVNGKDLRSFNLTFVKSEPVDKNKPVMGYRIKYIEDSKGVNTTNVTEPYFNTSNLNPCTKYCFNISTYNDAGFSLDIKHCVSTNATNLSEVKLTNISNGYQNERQINWTYNGNNTCPVSYTVKYWIKETNNETKIERINQTNYGIFHLQFNEIYEVRVFPVTEFDTADGIKIGNCSNIVEFFTGAENITVERFKVEYKYNEKKFNLSWSLNETLNFKIDAYIILIKNAQNICCAVIERKEQSSLRQNNEFYRDENQKLMKQNNCTTNGGAIKTYNATINYFEEIETSTNEREYVIELYTFNKLGFQRVQSLNFQIEIPANSGRAAVVSILVILIIGCLIYLAIRNREKLTNYFPFLSLFPFQGQNKHTNSEKANQQAIQMNEEKSQPVLDERFFDCNTLSEFLNKIDEYQRSLTDFPNYVLFMKENKDVRLIQEYGKLNNLAATLEHQLKLTKFIGKSPFNLKKNRFRNILPFDQNLVYLKSKSAPDNYLNASYIPFSIDDGSIEYIASQGPIDSTISDFILMIWEQNITCIVMLTRTYEDDKFKCLQYWPDDSNEIYRYGSQNEFLVAKLYEKEETSYFERKFSLKNSITHEERTIYHIHMHMWMDFSAPDLKDFCSVLSRFQDIRETIVNSPFLVHCSAGVGRTGTFICIDRIVRLINKGQQHIDVFKSVMELRASRNLLVQRHSQYIFIHEFLNFYIQKHLSDNVQVVSTV